MTVIETLLRKPEDLIQAGLLLAAVVGIGLTYWQARSSARTQRASFLKDLYSTLTADPEICRAYYAIEYGKFKYGPDFHGSEMEKSVDRLLSFADLVCELARQRVLTRQEMAFFQYRFLRLSDDADVRAYLQFLERFYTQVGAGKRPFHSFVAFAGALVASGSRR